MATARMEMRVDQKLKDKAEKAAALMGYRSLTEYVVHLVDEAATEDIEKASGFTAPDDVFDRFVAACDKATRPNKALRDAAAFAKEKGFIKS